MSLRVMKYIITHTTVFHLSGSGDPELIKFQEHDLEYKITVYQCLACEDKMFDGQVDSPKRNNLLYIDIERNYHVIGNITGATA